ncbi:MAG: LpqB family beta-propeller domain-containing protein, partial [Candidatus Bipolaricaulota bacterium]
VTDRDRDWEIYVRNADGSSPQRLTRSSGFDIEPSWSPDGARIAFASKRDGNYEIYVMNTDGTTQRRLTNHPTEDQHPAWSPDSSLIAFVTRRDGNFEIYVVCADGTRPRNMTTSSPTPDWDPAWASPRALAIRPPSRLPFLPWRP